MADEALSAGAVARRLGVAVTTLRTWHQRYGLGPSRHVPGQHRRYTAQDLNRLEVMLRLTSQGVAPAEAAAWARRTPIPAASPPVSSPSAAVGLVSPLSPVPGQGPDGGGLAIPLGQVVPAARGLARAAMRLDAPLMREILAAAVVETGVIAAWTDVAMPVLIGVGERYEATRRFVEVEHLISRCVTEVLSAVPRPPSGKSPRVLLAAADEEQHTLPLEALAAALAEDGVPTRLLGPRVPPQALDDTITRTGPVAVILWSSMPHTGDPAQLVRVAAHPHPPLLLAAAGPGWPGPALPEGVVHLTDLLQAANLARAVAA
ncbi:MerR family transcriptional regulator [Paractinoplanes durhamensis]|uniref:MerR family transcriptional regulator n=1 Tax=Paractinoplanes durhamensis TaxID=113563 RepID=UPI001940B7B5|nr:MerR family transcriptional regulator [Actinoplanes durhamensis]